MTSITVHKRNHLGERILQYDGEILDRGETWVCLRAEFNFDAADLGFVKFCRGDMFIEWFFNDRWYNIFQVHDGDSTAIKGWYCNITRPAYIGEDTVEADDLALDVFITLSGTIMLLDEKEFDALNLTTSERMTTLRAVEQIRRMVAEREPPFNAIRIDVS